VLITLLLKLVFYPLSETSGKSMAKMRVLAPRIKNLQDTYKEDREKLGKAMMELYQREKINPLAGCLPILIQMPVFFAFYWVLLESVEMRQAPFMGWIQDLSAKDPFFILPIIMAGAMFIQYKLNPAPPDPIQAKVFMILPLVMSVTFAFFPAGLVLYWVTNTVLSIAQQWNINRASTATDTIAAIATAPGRGALGVIRASGPAVPALLQALVGALPPARQASYRAFNGVDGAPLDAGLVIYFPAPASYTGEHVCELHSHGNPVLLHALLQALCGLGARLARPGEFSERAYRNGKLDLAQAEAVADLIECRSLRAARSALRTLKGEFSTRIHALVDEMTRCRVAFEGAIDFPDDIPGDALAAAEYPRIDALRNAIGYPARERAARREAQSRRDGRDRRRAQHRQVDLAQSPGARRQGHRQRHPRHHPRHH
jgi:YidC/Oxa1 family membrane protein insertase